MVFASSRAAHLVQPLVELLHPLCEERPLRALAVRRGREVPVAAVREERRCGRTRKEKVREKTGGGFGFITQSFDKLEKIEREILRWGRMSRVEIKEILCEEVAFKV